MLPSGIAMLRATDSFHSSLDAMSHRSAVVMDTVGSWEANARPMPDKSMARNAKVKNLVMSFDFEDKDNSF